MVLRKLFPSYTAATVDTFFHFSYNLNKIQWVMLKRKFLSGWEVCDSTLSLKTLEKAAICWHCLNKPMRWSCSTFQTIPHEGLFRIILNRKHWIYIVDSAAIHLWSITTSWDTVDPAWCRDSLVSISNYSVCWNGTFELPSVGCLQKHVLSGWMDCVWSGGCDMQFIFALCYKFDFSAFRFFLQSYGWG